MIKTSSPARCRAAGRAPLLRKGCRGRHWICRSSQAHLLLANFSTPGRQAHRRPESPGLRSVPAPHPGLHIHYTPHGQDFQDPEPYSFINSPVLSPLEGPFQGGGSRAEASPSPPSGPQEALLLREPHRAPQEEHPCAAPGCAPRATQEKPTPMQTPKTSAGLGPRLGGTPSAGINCCG